MNSKRKKNEGITLIALVITIVVLLILAGITIAALSGDNGILTQAKNAKEGSQPDNVEYQFSSDVDLQKNRMLFTWCNRAFIALALYIPFCEAFGFSLGNLRFCIIKCLYFVYAVLVLMFPLCISKETEEKDKAFYALEIGVGLLLISLELAVVLFFVM